MIDIDKWIEIFNFIQWYLLWIIFIVFGVFWGIFMLIILFGVGDGLQNGVEYEFCDDVINSMWIWNGIIFMFYWGLFKGWCIEFINEDYDMLCEQFDDIEYLIGCYYFFGDQMMVYKDKRFFFIIWVVYFGYCYLENILIDVGCYISE